MLGFQRPLRRLGILRNPGEYTMIDALLEMLSGFVEPVSEYSSAVWCSAADTHLKLLDLLVSGVQFLTDGVFE